MPSLAITVVSAYNMPKKAGLFDKTDPYVMIQVGAQKAQTSAKQNAGDAAEYNEVLTFAYNGEPELTVYLYDDEKRKDEALGSAKLPISNIIHSGYRGAVTVVNEDGEAQGEVLLHISVY